MQKRSRRKTFRGLSESSHIREPDMSEIFLGLGSNGERQVLRLGRANRHGLIAGATGTGKTVTLQTIAEQFSAAGVPVFMADVKGDLAGISMAGSHDFKHADKLESRAAEHGLCL
jgi:MoxR-like ATPase